jgi:hypothetical protein
MNKDFENTLKSMFNAIADEQDEISNKLIEDSLKSIKS